MGGRTLLYTTTESAKYLGISPSTLRRWLKQGRVTANKDEVTGQLTFERLTLDKLRKAMPASIDVNNLMSQLTVLSDSIREIQQKQDELLDLLRAGAHLGLENLAASSPAAAGNGLKAVKNNLSSAEYTQQLIKRYEEGGLGEMPKDIPGHLLNRQAIAAEFDKAWRLGDNSKQEWLKSLLHKLTVEATGS